MTTQEIRDTGRVYMEPRRHPCFLGLTGILEIRRQTQASPGLTGDLGENFGVEPDGRLADIDAAAFFRSLTEAAQIRIDLTQVQIGHGTPPTDDPLVRIFGLLSAVALACRDAGFTKREGMAWNRDGVSVQIERRERPTVVVQIDGQTVVRSRDFYKMTRRHFGGEHLSPDYAGRMRDEVCTLGLESEAGGDHRFYNVIGAVAEPLAVQLPASVTIKCDLGTKGCDEFKPELLLPQAVGEALRTLLYDK